MAPTPTAGTAPARASIAPSTWVLVGELMVIAALGTAIFGGWQPPAVLGHRWHVALHVLGAVLSLGNFIAGAFLLAFTGRSGDRRVYPFVSHAIQWADIVLSAPGVLLLLYNGGVIAQPFGGAMGAQWLRTCAFLSMASGALWAFVLVPLQNRLITLSHDERTAPDWERLARRYSAPGTVAGLAVLTVLILMVLKPS